MIELNILHYAEGEEELEKLGIETSSEENWKAITFYNINAIGKATDANRSLIYINGDSFICSISYEELKEKLKNI